MTSPKLRKAINDLVFFYQDATLGLHGTDWEAVLAPRSSDPSYEPNEQAMKQCPRYNRVKLTLELIPRRCRTVLKAAYEPRNRNDSRTLEARSRAAKNKYVEERLKAILGVKAVTHGEYVAENEIVWREQQAVAMKIVYALEEEHKVKRKCGKGGEFTAAKRVVSRLKEELEGATVSAAKNLADAHSIFASKREEVMAAVTQEKEALRKARVRRRDARGEVRREVLLPKEKSEAGRMADELRALGFGGEEELTFLDQVGF